MTESARYELAHKGCLPLLLDSLDTGVSISFPILLSPKKLLENPDHIRNKHLNTYQSKMGGKISLKTKFLK